MRQHRLWTPIANAFEAHRRRLIAEPSAVFEHIWRLLHIEESLVVTLGAALACRLRALWIDSKEKQSELNHLVRLITGMPSADDSDDVIEQNCLTGSIDAWINVLQRYGKADIAEDSFCAELGEYLTEDVNEKIAFLDVWQRIAPVPEVHKRESHSRLERIRAINGFRNKLAHVPISHKVLDEIYRGMRLEVVRLLSDDDALPKAPAYDDLRTTQFHSALRGGLGNDCGLVTGSDYQQLPPNFADRHDKPPCWFTWNSPERNGDSVELLWNASPFVRLDAELKVVLLFRVNGLVTEPDNDEFPGEYHRFAAEIEPVRHESVPNELLRPWFPTDADPPDGDSAVIDRPIQLDEGLTREQLRDQLSEAFKRRQYGAANELVVLLQARDEHILSESELLEYAGSAFRDRAVSVGSTLWRRARTRDRYESHPEDLRNWAEIAFRDRQYKAALELFDELAGKPHEPRYNDVAKLKHGMSMWRVADSTEGPDDRDERVAMLRRAIELLESAEGHVDQNYVARAKYQRSKALWHLWQHEQDRTVHALARECAKDAALIAYEPSYVSWNDRLEGEAARFE